MRSPRLTILRLGSFEALTLVVGRPRAWTPALSLPDPLPERLTRVDELLCGQRDRRPLRGLLLLVLKHQPDLPLAYFRRIPLRRVDDSNRS